MTTLEKDWKVKFTFILSPTNFTPRYLFSTLYLLPYLLPVLLGIGICNHLQSRFQKIVSVNTLFLAQLGYMLDYVSVSCTCLKDI